MQLTSDQHDPAPAQAALEPVGYNPQESRFALLRGLSRLGLQGKLILSFMYLLVLALAGSCWLFTSQSSERVADIMGEQARQISYALSLASRSAIESRNSADLERIGLDLLKTRNILFVSFLDPEGKPLAL